ncbi:MAG: hypothetical protein ACLRMJ_11380 [Alistipes finegoldii]
MRVFTHKGATPMTPRDSILHHSVSCAAMVSLDPATGFVKACVGGPNFRYFDMASRATPDRLDDQALRLHLAIDHLADALHDGSQPADDHRDGQRYGLVAKEAGNEYDGVLHPSGTCAAATTTGVDYEAGQAAGCRGRFHS